MDDRDGSKEWITTLSSVVMHMTGPGMVTVVWGVYKQIDGCGGWLVGKPVWGKASWMKALKILRFTYARIEK